MSEGVFRRLRRRTVAGPMTPPTAQAEPRADLRDDVESLRATPHAQVLIIGGGINGVGTFRDLALQGVESPSWSAATTAREPAGPPRT